MVNDLHRLGPGSVGVGGGGGGSEVVDRDGYEKKKSNREGGGGGGGGGGGRRRKAQNGMNSKQTSTSEASLAVEWSLHGFPYGSQIFFSAPPPRS